jgi:hypothetical protein
MEALDQSLFGPGLSQDVLIDCTIRLATLGSSVEVSPDNRVGCSNTSRIEKVRGQPPQEDPYCSMPPVCSTEQQHEPAEGRSALLHHTTQSRRTSEQEHDMPPGAS